MAFDIYKPGMGKYTRLCSAFGAAIIVAIGCWRLYQKLAGVSWGMSDQMQFLISRLVPAALFVVLGLFIYQLLNKPVVSDFMIAAEGEMKKVSWSSKKEIAVSTFIVIVVIIIFAVLLGVADLIFNMFFSWLFLGG